MNPDLVFLFCIGAQKSGTSWLWRYLGRHPDVYSGPFKELHYFNSKSTEAMARRRNALQAAKDRHKAETSLIRQPRRYLRDRIRFQRYESLFDGPINIDRYREIKVQEAPWANLTCDFTPAYSILDVEDFAQMAKVHSDVRFIYLLRDPVARLWSQIRMEARRANAFGTDSPPDDIQQFVERRRAEHSKNQIEARSDYLLTLSRLKEAGVWDRTLVLFYEELFGQERVASRSAILEHVGLRPSPIKTPNKVHRGMNVALPAALEQEFFETLRPQYEGLPDVLGRDIPTHWHVRTAKRA